MLHRAFFVYANMAISNQVGLLLVSLAITPARDVHRLKVHVLSAMHLLIAICLLEVACANKTILTLGHPNYVVNVIPLTVCSVTIVFLASVRNASPILIFTMAFVRLPALLDFMKIPQHGHAMRALLNVWIA